MNIFGGNTGMSYEQLQRQRAIADKMLEANQGTPRNVGEGLSAIGRALAARAIEKRTSRREGELKEEADDLWQSVFGGMGGQSSAPQTYAAPAPAVSTTNIEGKSVADDTMRALGKEPLGMPAEVRAGVFAGESGGDYDAVFGYQQRPGGQFEGVKPSEMRVAEVLQFQDPSGPYGQYVKGQVGRVATPVGAYQVVGTTLREAVKAGVVSPDEKFTPEVQDRVGDWVYKTQGTGAWEGYRGPGGGGQGGGQGGVAPARIASTQAIAEALSNPYIRQDPGKVAILQALLQQQLAPPPTMTPYQQAQLDMRRQELEMRQAGTWGDGTNVTVNNAPGGGVPADEEELRKKLGGKEGELWATYIDQGGVSAGTMQDMQLLDELITQAPQGPLSGRIANAFPGVNSAADAFNSVVKRVAPTLRAPGSGSTSDIEYEGMLKALPQLSARPEANRAIAAMMKAKAQINIERAEVVRAYQNNEISVTDARRQMSEIDNRSIMTPELQSIISATGSAAPEADDDGFRDVGDGIGIRRKE